MLLRFLDAKVTGEKRASWGGHLLPQGTVINIKNERAIPQKGGKQSIRDWPTCRDESKPQKDWPDLTLGLRFLHAVWLLSTCLGSLDRLQRARQPDMRSCVYQRKLCS